MSKTSTEILDIYKNADTEGKRMILSMLLCATTIGQGFYSEMNELLELGSKDAMLQSIKKWEVLASEKSEVI